MTVSFDFSPLTSTPSGVDLRFRFNLSVHLLADLFANSSSSASLISHFCFLLSPFTQTLPS